VNFLVKSETLTRDGGSTDGLGDLAVNLAGGLYPGLVRGAGASEDPPRGERENIKEKPGKEMSERTHQRVKKRGLSVVYGLITSVKRFQKVWLGYT
jgi:hypothetical protein